MSTAVNAIANERQLSRNYWGTEVRLGVPVTPTYRMYGDLRVNRARPLADRQEFAGTYFKDYTPVRGGVVIDGTYAQTLTYEDLPILLRYSVQGGVTGTSDGATTPGYTYVQKPTASRKDIDYATVEGGFPGMPWVATGLHLPEFTISADIDDTEAAWKWSGSAMALTKDLDAVTSGVATAGTTTTITKAAAGWVVNEFAGGFVEMTGGATTANVGQKREILSNTATVLTVAGVFPSAVANTDTFVISGTFTAGITDRTRETIEAPDTSVYIDTGTIGTTEITGRIISWSVNYNINASGKRFMDNPSGFSRFGHGATVVTGQIRVEGDERDEYDAWTADTAQKIRFQQTGTVIDTGTSTHKLARIDVHNVQYDTLTDDDRDNNVTYTIGFRGFVDATAGVPITFTTKNALSALP